MATIITEECINCGACEPECPNTAIYQAGVEYEWQGKKYPALSAEFFYIVPQKCTECVGFFDHEACAAVCPVDCCIPDPSRLETEDVLLQRAREIHPDKSFGTDAPSRFRKGVAAIGATLLDTPAVAAPESSRIAAPAQSTPAAPGAEAAASSAGPATKLAPAAAPETAATPAAPKSKIEPAVGVVTSTTTTDAPVAPKAPMAPAPAAKPIVAAKAAKPVPASPPASAARAESVVAAVATPSAATATSAVTATIEKPISNGKKVVNAGDPTRDFAGELAISFDEALRRVRRRRQAGRARGAGLALVAASPLLGALDHDAKRTIERAYGDSRLFSVRLATALNVVLDFLLYPIGFFFLGLLDGTKVLTQADKTWLVYGVLLASTETLVRLRDGIIRSKPAEEIRYGPSFYGFLLRPMLGGLFSRLVRRRQSGWIPVEGFYSRDFEPKREREKRYGEVYTIEELDGGYYLRMEMPRRIPHSAAKHELGLGDDMPDYDLHIAVENGGLTVRGSVVDPDLRAVCGVSPAFPADFRTEVPLQGSVAGFRHRYADKLLEVVVIMRRGT